MFAFGLQKKEKLMRLEKKVRLLVERKEQRLQKMDEDGREIVLSLNEHLSNFNQNRKNIRRIISQAERYLRENNHYF